MASNQISLFNKIDKKDLVSSGFQIVNKRLTYEHANESREIDLSKLEGDTVYINEIDSLWVPTNHNLNLYIKFYFKDTTVFFGPSSATNKENKLGLAAKIYSKGSNFQEIVKLSEITSFTKSQDIEHTFNFPHSFFRDSFNIEFFIYLMDVKVKGLGQAQDIGTILNVEPLYIFTVFVDGDGSIFPITEFREPNGPFWRLEKSWVSPEEDTFDSSNIRLAINIEHELFEQVNSGRLKTSQKLMNDIITQAMAMIIQEVLIVQNANISEADESVENSILRIVRYWVDTFEVETDSIFSITNSLNRNIERAIRGDLN